MPGTALVLLDGVSWQGASVSGERLAALLAALATHPEGVTDARLIQLIWDQEEPANPTKALQVLVSRTRTALGAGAVLRYDGGYRLGVPPDDVDALLLRRLTRDASAALERGAMAEAAALAERAARLDVAGADSDLGAIAELRHDALADRRHVERVLGLALAATGRDAEALPYLEAVHARASHDTTVTAALLRSVAATSGPAEALDRYEAYRAELAERLGVDPDPGLQRLHLELLAADSPVRDGVHFDADDLLGRKRDLADLRAAVRRSRLVSIVGPGGLGKTRVAHVLAREASQPRVYFVELVGVTSGDDVLAEVGAVLGVRGSVTGRRTLTPAQLADVRSQLAAELDTAPTLLVLDNCEHVLESVASLVALLLVTTRDLHVLTTSRAPLGLAAEQVVALRQLAADDASELFVQRARAARADADLPADAVADIVSRLDGLPLAIELAAARVRTMTVTEVRRRLDDLFDLLRTRDRSAPERHRTLSAVIDWSWALLGADAQEAMARLSVFHDGFTREAALAVLGRSGPDLVETLAEQSLVTVTEAGGTTRFRMLETVREFAADRLAASGLREDAQHRQDEWALAFVERCGAELFGPEEFTAVDLLGAEENNLADVLRRALRASNRPLVAQILGYLGAYWTISGNHARVFAIADAAEALLADWEPTEEPRLAAQLGLSWLIVHLSWMPHRSIDDLRATLARWGVPEHPWARVAYEMFVVEDAARVDERLASLAQSADPPTAQMALLWASLVSENAGELGVAAAYARDGLAHPPLTPYLEGALHSQLAQLAMSAGDHKTASRHAAIAFPIMRRLHAGDDAYSLRVISAIGRILDGDADAAERILDEIEHDGVEKRMGAGMVLQVARAEVALARGNVATGLTAFDAAVEAVRLPEGAEFGGLSPWVLLAASGSLVARVRYARGPEDEARARELRDLLVEQHGLTSVDGALPYLDFPLNGVLLAALGAWILGYGAPHRREAGVRLLALADRWAYNRSFPVLAWEWLRDLAEQARPGLLDELTATYAARPATELVEEAQGLLRVAATSSE